MNAFQKIVFNAGQKVHEDLFGAELTFPGYGDLTVPCNHSEILKDFEFAAGGKSPRLFIETLTFRAELIPDTAKLEKYIWCDLNMGNGIPVVALQLWAGGLTPGGILWKFSAADRNYKV